MQTVAELKTILGEKAEESKTDAKRAAFHERVGALLLKQAKEEAKESGTNVREVTSDTLLTLVNFLFQNTPMTSATKTTFRKMFKDPKVLLGPESSDEE